MGNTATRPLVEDKSPAKAGDKGEQRSEPSQSAPKRELRATIVDEEEDGVHEQLVPSDHHTVTDTELSHTSTETSSDEEDTFDETSLEAPRQKSHASSRVPKQPLDFRAAAEQRRKAIRTNNPRIVEDSERRCIVPRLQRNTDKAIPTPYIADLPRHVPLTLNGISKRESTPTRMDLPPRCPDETLEDFIARVKDVYLQDPHPRYTNVPHQLPGETTQQWIDRVADVYTQNVKGGNAEAEERERVLLSSDNQERDKGPQNESFQTLLDETTERLNSLDTGIERGTTTAPRSNMTASMERLAAGAPPMKRPHHQFAFWDSCTADNVDANLAAKLKDPAHVNVGLMNLMQEDRNSAASKSKRVRWDESTDLEKGRARACKLGGMDGNTQNDSTVADDQPLPKPSRQGYGDKGGASKASKAKVDTAKEGSATEAKIKNDKGMRSKAKEGKAKEGTAKKRPGKADLDKATPRDQYTLRKQVHCPLLENLPLEIRLSIYQHLLVAKKVIRGGELVEDKQISLIIPDQRPPMLDLGIDATFLRTCRQIYHEALPILYQNNTIGFSEVHMIKTFKKEGLPRAKCSDSLKSSMEWILKGVPQFNFEPAPQGRFSLVRKLHLRFGDDPRPSTGHGRHRHYFEPNQWSKFLHENPYEEKGKYTYFPSLVHLVLDFSDWKLKPGEGIAVRPFVEKFRVPNGLQSLTLVGLLHESSDWLMQGLVAKNGVLKLHPRNHFPPF